MLNLQKYLRSTLKTKTKISVYFRKTHLLSHVYPSYSPHYHPKHRKHHRKHTGPGNDNTHNQNIGKYKDMGHDSTNQEVMKYIEERQDEPWKTIVKYMK